MKTVGRLILSAIFLVLTGVMAAAARTAPDAVFAFYPAFSRKVLAAVSSVTAVVPFCIWEVAVLLAVLWLVYTLVRVFRHHGRGILSWLSGIVLTLCVFLFAFVGVWGLNHFGPDVSQQLGLSVREYSAAELTEATRYYAQQATRLASGVRRDEKQVGQFSDFSTLAKQAGKGYETLGQEYALFTGSTDRVKKLASWKLFSHFGITGIFICVTGEACVNPDTYVAWLPFTMCHEIGHRMAFARENEANFAAFLACEASEDARFTYSGYYTAFLYCYNALRKVDAAAANEVWSGACDELRADCAAANSHYKKVEDQKVSQVTDKIYNSYLQTVGVESGRQSYGEVVDLLTAWYFTQEATQ